MLFILKSHKIGKIDLFSESQESHHLRWYLSGANFVGLIYFRLVNILSFRRSVATCWNLPLLFLLE